MWGFENGCPVSGLSSGVDAAASYGGGKDLEGTGLGRGVGS